MSPIFMEFSYLWKLPFGIFPRAHCPCVKKRVDKMMKFPRVQLKELLVVPDWSNLQECWHDMRELVEEEEPQFDDIESNRLFCFLIPDDFSQMIRWFSLRVTRAECPWDGRFLSCSEGNWTVTKHSLNSAFAFDPTLDMVKKLSAEVCSLKCFTQIMQNNNVLCDMHIKAMKTRPSKQCGFCNYLLD